MSKGKESDPEVDIHIVVPSSLRAKIYDYLEVNGGHLKPFLRGLVEDFFEQQDWLNHRIGKNRRRKRYWDKEI